MYQCPIFFRFDTPSAHTVISAAVAAWFADNGWGTPPQSGVRHRLCSASAVPAGADAENAAEDGSGSAPFAAHVSRLERGTRVHSGQYVAEHALPADDAGPRADSVRTITPGPEHSAIQRTKLPAARSGLRRAERAAPAQDGRVRTTVTYAMDSAGAAGWLLVRHESESPIMRTPAIATRLIHKLGGMDGAHPITAGAQMIQPPSLPTVVDALTSADRTRPLLIVGSAHDLPLRKFADLIGTLVADAEGLVLAYVLDGPATAAFDEAVPETMRIGAGAARLFAPVPRAASSTGATGRRGDAPPIDSRMIGIERLLSDDYGLRRELWHLALRTAIDAGLPEDVEQTTAALRERAEACRLPVTPRPERGPAAAVLPADTAETGDAADAATATEPTNPAARADPAAPSDNTEPAERAGRREPAESSDDQARSDGPPDQLPRTRAGGLPGGTLGALLADVLDDVCSDPAVTHRSLGELRTLARRGMRRTREYEADRAERKRLEAELAAARRTIDELHARLGASEPGPGAGGSLPGAGARGAHADVDAACATGRPPTTDRPPTRGGTGSVDGAGRATPDAEPAGPESFADLLERLEALPGVQFTGSPRAALRLDRQSHAPVYARKAWRAAAALSDYAAARLTGDGPSSVREYLSTAPLGHRAVSQHNHSSVESDSTAQSPSYRSPRTLPVPDYVHTDGAVFMGAHFKLGGGNISPRMHYYDDTAASGLVFIGYIGEHLPNRSTN